MAMQNGFISNDMSCVSPMVQYEENRKKYTDQRDAVQKKTFTKWVNKHLIKTGRRIVDIFEDLKDGHNLISLLEVLAHEVLPREPGHMRFHKIQNVQIALDFLKFKGIRLVNIRSDEIVNGNPKLTLGLIWTIILHFQISPTVVPGQPEDISARDALLYWSRRTTEGYPGVKITDFSKSWRDGKAFLAIIHRNRPDLVDFRKVRQQTARQNLETAFDMAERDLGVTKLLDPEDVDVREPDERSVITYVSSLYDVFPNVPSTQQSLQDNERQLKIEEYRDLATALLTWLRDVHVMMDERKFSSSLLEMKALLQDFNKFRSEEVPPRLDVKQRLFKIFEQIKNLSTDKSNIGVEEELYPDNINRFWTRFTAALQERDMSMQSEILRLERLQRLAERVNRDCKINEETLNTLEKRIHEEERRIESVHPFEAKRSCDAIDRDLHNIEDITRNLFRDVQSLQDGRHPQADHLYRRVSDLQSRLSQLRTYLYSNVIQPLLSKSYVEEGRTLTKRTEVVTEVRLVDTNPAFKHIQECLIWIDAKQQILENAEYDSDLSRLQKLIREHQLDHKEVVAFRTEIDQCVSNRQSLSSEEQQLYTQKLSKLEVAYSLLTNTSNRREKGLASLVDFVEAAADEVFWLSQLEDREVTRDWSSRDLNLSLEEEYLKSLIRQLESREGQFNAVQERGGAMVLDRHPASNIVEAFMSTMQSQWSWMIQLTSCLELHLKHSQDYYQFFEDVRQCEQWTVQHTDLLTKRYNRANIPVEEAELLLRELQELQEQLKEYDRRVSSLILRSHEVIPLPQRGRPVHRQIKARTLCTYHQAELSLSKGEECFLMDNTHKQQWKIKTSSGNEAIVPSVCLLIPPPNQDAIDYANRLKIQLDHLSSLWRQQQRKLRKDMVFATINIVKAWDLKKFCAMDPGQREAIWRALNDDAQKLLSDLSKDDKDKPRLKKELELCNKIFLDLSAQAAALESQQSRSSSENLIQQLDSINRNLGLCDQQLSSLLHKQVPQSRIGIQEAFQGYRDFEKRLDNQEREIDSVQKAYVTVTQKSQLVESKLNLVVQKFGELKAISHVYVQRLKTAESTVSGLDEVKQIVSDYEITLSSHDNMTSDINMLSDQQEELREVQSSIQQQQPKMDHLRKDVGSLRSLVENSRQTTMRHHDVEAIEKDVKDLGARWDNVCIQVVERLRSIDASQDLLSVYHNGVQSEFKWVDQMEAKINSHPPLTGDVVDAKQQLEPTMAIYNSLGERRHQIENVNRLGGQYIREAKIYDKRLRHYRESLEEIDAGLVASISKRGKRQDGAETVKIELDNLNTCYMDMVKWTNMRLKQITAILSDANVQFQMVIDDEIPLLRTFRAELAKRSSMLVDDDMHEFFQQLSDVEQSHTTYRSLVNHSTIQTGSTASAELTPSPRQTYVIGSGLDSPQTSPQLSFPTVHSDRFTQNRLSQKIATISSISMSTYGHDSMRLEEGPIHGRYQTVFSVKNTDVSSRGLPLHVDAVLNPQTSQRLTLMEAINAGLVDLQSKTFYNPQTREKMTLTQAALKGLIDESLHQKLNSPCGISDPKNNQELVLIDAIAKGLYVPATNKVIDSTTGELLTVAEAVKRAIVSKTCANALSGEPVSLTSITHTQAVFANSEPLRTEMPLSLAQVVSKGLFDGTTGKVIDPVSNTEMTVLQAVEKGFINPSFREIDDPNTGNFISLTEAVTKGIIDPVVGMFKHRTTNQKLSLDEAHRRGLLKMPAPLSAIVINGDMLENGTVFDKNTGLVLSLSEAVNAGVLDGERKCIVDQNTKEVLSVTQAIQQQLLDTQGLYIPPDSHDPMPILDAIDQGYMKLVSEDVSFSLPGIKDTLTGETVSVPEALKRGILTDKGTMLDRRSNHEMSLQEASRRNLITNSLLDNLMKPSSLKDRTGRNISVLQGLEKGILDPEQGMIRDPQTNRSVSFQEATSLGLITNENSMEILGLISPLVTSTTILTHIQQSPLEVITALSVSEATSQGLLNTTTGQFTDPNTGRTMSIEEAIQKGYLILTSQWPDSAHSLNKSYDEIDKLSRLSKEDASKLQVGEPVVESSYMTRKGSNQFSFTTTMISKPLVTTKMISETKEMTVKSVVDPKSGREISVAAAKECGLIDIERGFYRDPSTCQTMPIVTAVEKGYIIVENGVHGDHLLSSEPIKEIRSYSITGVIHPKTGKRMPVSQAVKDGILEQENGIYNGVDKFGKVLQMPISEAIKLGYVIAEDISTTVSMPGSLLRETKTYNLKSVKHPRTDKNISIVDAISQGMLKEDEGVYINFVTKERLPIHEAIEKGYIEAELVSVLSNTDADVNKITTTKLTTLSVTAVVDPRTGKLITVAKATEDGILDHSKRLYKNQVTGESMSINDAIEKKLVLTESTEATDSDHDSDTASIHSIHITEEAVEDQSTYCEDISSETTSISITSVVDPDTRECISYDAAIEKGIINIDRGVYVNARRGELTIASALDKGLIIGEVISKQIEEETFKSSVEAETPTLSMKNITSVIDPRTGEQISLQKAIKDELINVDNGTFWNTKTGEEMDLDEALHQGFINPSKHSDAVELEKSLDYSEDEMNPQILLSKSFDSDKPWSSVDIKVEKSVIDDSVGSILANEVLHYSADIESSTPKTKYMKEDMQSQYLKQSFMTPLNLIDAVDNGIFSEYSGKFSNQQTGKTFTLYEGLTENLIDKHLVTVKNTKTGERIPLERAIQLGLIDGFTAEVVDKVSRKRLSLPDAISRGLVQNVLNVQSGLVTDIRTGDLVPLSKAIAEGNISTESITVLDTSTGNQVSMDVAYRKGLVDRKGNVIDKEKGTKMTAQDALKFGLMAVVGAPYLAGKMVIDAVRGGPDQASDVNKFPAASTFVNGNSQDVKPSTTIIYAKSGDNIQPTRPNDGISASSYDDGFDDDDDRIPSGRLADSYDKLIQDLNSELNRIADFEQLLKDDEQMADEAYKLQSQLEAYKAIHKEIDSIRQPILSLVYQAEQLTEHYQEELVPEQVTELQGMATSTKTALDKLVKTADIRLKHLISASDELQKFEDESNKFKIWMTTAERELDRQEECLQRFEDLKPLAEKQKALLSDVISHQADARFMAMASQKYLEEAKLYKLEIDAFKADRHRPARHSLISMNDLEAESVRDELKDISGRHHDLKTKVQGFGDRLANLATKQVDYNESAFKMLTWLTEAEDQLSSIKQDSGSPVPNKLKHQLDRLKSLSSDSLSQAGLFHDTQKKGGDLTNCLSGISAEPSQIQNMQKTMRDISDRYNAISKDVSNQTNKMQAAITKSQGVQEAISGILDWLKDTDKVVSNQQSISLNRVKLDDQVQAFKYVEADVDNHKFSIDSVRQKTNDLIKNCDLEMARSLEEQLGVIDKKYSGIKLKCKTHDKDLDEISIKVRKFNEGVEDANCWLEDNIEALKSKDMSKLPSDELKDHLHMISLEKQKQRQASDDIRKLAKDLIKDKRSGETGTVDDAVAKLVDQWAILDRLFSEKEHEAKNKEKKGNEFDHAKNIIILWLNSMESQLDEFEPVGIDIETVERQITRLQPLLEDFEQQEPNIDEINDLGNAFETLQAPDRPMSPIRRHGRIGSRRISGLLSPRLRSPSPTMFPGPASPLSSESSGISSRKSSSDYLLLDDLSETQQQLLDINQRYEIIGERLADRHQELQNILGSIKTFLQDLQDMLSWLDIKDQEANYQADIPTNEKDAKKKLNEHKNFHHELLGKEALVEDIRKKAQDLIRTRQGVPGLDTLQNQLSQLDDKWHGLRATSEQRRKSLEDMVTDLRDLREHGDQLQKWLNQKEKMLDVLGPMAIEPVLLENQLDQVKVLKEEFTEQEPLFERFIQSGHSVLDKCRPNSVDSSNTSRKIDTVSKSWDKLHDRLKEREQSLSSLGGIGAQFSDVTKSLGGYLADVSDHLENLQPVSSSPEQQRRQIQETMELGNELSGKKPDLKKAKDLCKKLCDCTKDPSTKSEVKNKLAALEKGYNDVGKKLDARLSALENANREGEKFQTNCNNVLDWVQDMSHNLKSQEPLSGERDVLQQQAQDLQNIQQEIAVKMPELKELFEKGGRMLEEATPTPDMRQLQEKLQAIQSDWDQIKVVANAKQDKVTEANDHSQKFHDNMDKLLLWLQIAEDKLDKAKPKQLDKASISKKLKDLQALQNDVLKKSHDHDTLNREGDALLDCVEIGKNDIQDDMDEVNKRWEDLNQDIGESSQNLEDMQLRLSEINDNMSDANTNLKRWEDKLDSHLRLGPMAKDPKHADKMKALQEDAQGINGQLDYLEALVEGISVDGGADTQGLEADVNNLKFRQKKLQDKLDDVISEMESGSQSLAEFQALLRDAGGQLSNLENDLNKKEPIGRDEQVLDTQLQDMDNFMVNLVDKEHAIRDLENKGRDLLRSGVITDPDIVKSKVDNLKHQEEKMKEQAKQRKADIKVNKEKLHKLNEKLGAISKNMDVAGSKFDTMKPVGGDVKAIKQQQDELKNFVKKVIEPLQKQIEVTSSDGQALIMSAPSGVDCDQLEVDLENLTGKWSDLNEKVGEREHNLDSALLNSGKFTDALDSLLAWLAETEDLVANQKPSSPEHRVVKAQLQEQKFLQKMLEDRAPSILSVRETGDKLQARVDSKEQKKIQAQMQQLEERWDNLNRAASDRMNTLEDVMELAKDFQDIHDPLSTWLDISAKRFASMEPKALDVDGIERLVGDLRTLQDDVSRKDGSVRDLAIKGKQLQDHCKGEDVVLVQVKIDDCQHKYSDLKNKVADTLEQMEETLPLARNFNEKHNQFLDWIAKIEPEVRGKEHKSGDAEDHLQILLDELENIQPILEEINHDGSELIDLAPGDLGLRVDETINKDNKRYDSIKDQLEKRAEKVRLARQKSFEVLGELDDLLEWFDEEEGRMLEMEPISCTPDKLQSQLVEQKTMNDDISSQKSKARDAITAGKKLLRESPPEEEPTIREKMDQLKSRAENLSRMSNDRLSQLEQALPLAKHFLDTHNDLQGWLDEIEPIVAEMDVMSINSDQVKKQQEQMKTLKQDVTDHKPVVDRLNKIGHAMLKLCGPEDADRIKDMMEDDNRRVDELRNAVRERSNSIEEAMQQSADFSDQLEDLLENLTKTAEEVKNAEPIAAYPDKIRGQISDNAVIEEDMDMREAALNSVRNTAEELLKQAGESQDDAVRDVKQKLDELVKLYNEIKDSTQDRGDTLEETLGVADKFWDELSNLTSTLKDLQENLSSQEPPALEPDAIREQQEELENLKDDTQATQSDFDDVQQTGQQLMSLVGEPDKPEVQKNIDDLDNQLSAINDDLEKRARSLEEALAKALTFQDVLMKLLVWLQKKEDQFSNMGPIGSDFEVLKKQLNDLKVFKADVEPKQIEIEALSQQANEMAKDSTADQAVIVKEPVAELKERWDVLIDNIAERQRLMQNALLKLGEFDHALKELNIWVNKTDDNLDRIQPVYGDSKVIGIEMAKLKIIQNDTQGHISSIDSINIEGQKLMANEGSLEISGVRQKLDDLNNGWELVQDKGARKLAELEEALQEAQIFTGDLQDVQVKLSDIENQLITSKPVGGLPETAKEQLEKFMEVFNDLKALEPRVSDALKNGDDLARKSREPASGNIRQNMKALQQRWDNCRSRAEDRKKKLEEAEGNAGNFHNDLNKFIAWLTEKERVLNNLGPVSRLVNRVTDQADEHSVLQKDISKNREKLIALEKMGTHLKYFSQKQDVILIKNLLSSVQHRWEKIVSRSAERTRKLERGYKEAKYFHDLWKDLLGWLVDAERTLAEDIKIGNEPEKIKSQIAKHKEFQKRLGAKQPKFDTVNRTGRALKDKCPSDDVPVLQQMLNELKNKWNSVCGMSVDRQRKFEEALLFSGQFNDALQALLDWLAKVEPTLGEDQPVHADIDTVNSLIDEHNMFQQELGARAKNVDFVRKSAKDLIEKSQEDTSELQAHLIELTTQWDRVCKLSVSKQERLEQAHKLADEFNKKANGLLEWLGDAERRLRLQNQSPVPEEETVVLDKIEEHKKFEESLLAQEANLRETLNIGQDIMRRCHPEGIVTMKHWLSVLRARWEELMSLTKQRERKLIDGLATLRRNNILLDELLAWLNNAEVKLTDLEREPVPQDVEIIKDLLKEHHEFQSNLSAKQPEVDRLTRPDKRRASVTQDSSMPSLIPRFRGSFRTPSKNSPSRSGRRTPDQSGRRTPDQSGRRTPDFSGRRTPDPSGRRTPDSSGRRTPEPSFRNPRVGALYNKWRHVWLMAMERHQKLQDALNYLDELERMKHFSFDDWRKRYLRWMHHNKARIIDFFRRQDRDRDGKVTRKEFIEGIIGSKFPTSRLEMETVADIFDHDRDGFIDYKEFVNALRPPSDKEPTVEVTLDEKIMDEVKRQASKCTCVKQFRIHKVGEGKYRFGDSQKLRLVRILRSTVMVRVGGGWVALDEFLVKNDPCRAKGKTNVELREQFVLATGVSQSMSGFVSKSPVPGSPYSSSSSRSPYSTPTGPISKIREKTSHSSPWQQKTKTPDGEVHHIMSRNLDGSRLTPPIKSKLFRKMASPSNAQSPVSRSSSRASNGGSRPPSRTGSETSEGLDAEVFTTLQTETENKGGRNNTTVTYQTHNIQTRTVTIPTPTQSKYSKIPKFSPRR